MTKNIAHMHDQNKKFNKHPSILFIPISIMKKLDMYKQVPIKDLKKKIQNYMAIYLNTHYRHGHAYIREKWVNLHRHLN